MQGLLGSALALTYVPYFEGFGIPILEAMYADIPVITANTTSMPEVGGDAVLLADPFQPQSIADQMTKLALDDSLRQLLIEKGRLQRQQFSWDRTAGLLWESVEKSLS